MVINATLANATISSNVILQRFTELVTAPYYHKDMPWIVLPLVIATLLMQLYFGRYKKEDRGWDSAVGNSLVLVFVTIDLVRHLHSITPDPTIMNIVFGNFTEVMLIALVALGGLWMAVGEFFHFIPKRIAAFLSSALPINLTAYMIIIVVYTAIPADLVTFIAAILLLIALIVVFKIIKFFEPVSIREEK